MQKVAAIIRHPYRDDDYRVDIYNVPEEYCSRRGYIKAYIQNNLLGHFEVVSITSRIQENCEFNGSSDDLAKFEEWLKNKEKENDPPTIQK